MQINDLARLIVQSIAHIETFVHVQSCTINGLFNRAINRAVQKPLNYQPVLFGYHVIPTTCEGYTMDRTIRDKWVAALRSGNYKQGRGALRLSAGSYNHEEPASVEDGFCCLGVLSDVVGAEWVFKGPGAKQTALFHTDGEEGEAHDNNLPPKMSIKLGLADYNRRWALGDEGDELGVLAVDFLIEANDVGVRGSWQWTFDQIADWIEANL